MSTEGSMSTMAKRTKKAANKEVSLRAAGKTETDPAMFNDDETGATKTLSVAKEDLRNIVERIERLEDEKKTVAQDIKEIYGEAKSRGFDDKALRKVISIRKQDQTERLEQDAIVDLYLHALGMANE